MLGQKLLIMYIDNYAISMYDVANNGCSWSVTKNTHAEGAIQSFKNISLVDCLDACRRLENCLAVDYVVSDRWCWWHTDINNLVNMATREGTDLYRKKSCPSGKCSSMCR